MAHLRRCLDRLGSSHEVVVVDNGSTDGSADLEVSYPNVRFIRVPRNFGRTKALNLGIRSAEGEFVLFLQADVEITPEAATQLALVLENRPEVGAVAPLLVDEDGHPEPQVARMPAPGSPHPAWEPSSQSEPECVSGAAVMVRSFFLKALRQIDERYGDYGSDLEICAQIRRAGKKIVVVTPARAVHHPGVPEPDGSQAAADRAIGTAVYLGKHFGFVNGIRSRIASTLGALFGFRLGEARLLLANQKVDGNQKNAAK